MNKLSLNDRKSLLDKFTNKTKASGSKREVISVNLDKKCTFKDFLLYKKIEAQASIAKQIGIDNPFMLCHETIAKDHTIVCGKDLLNFATYDYLGLNGDERVLKRAIDEMQKFGTSAGASRLVAGQRPIHKKLEDAIAKHYGQEDAIVLVSGHATNVSVISTLFSKDDLIIYDKLSHNSILLGAQFSGATCLAFIHNDMHSLEELLKKHRDNYKNTLIVTEGVFSMDGDIANLPVLVDLKNKYNAFLMIDEAHALGVVGKTGAGSFEHYNLNPKDIDIYMGTLSKTLCSCGGYIAGTKELVDILKYYSPGFVYSVGISPVLAAASLEALDLLHKEQFRVEHLQKICKVAKEYATSIGLDVGNAQSTAVLPIIIGASVKATVLSNLLYQEGGVLALPIIYPAVEEEKARIRLFLSYSHNEDEIKQCLDTILRLDKKAQEIVQDYMKNPQEQ